jgi:hypothetical protein
VYSPDRQTNTHRKFENKVLRKISGPYKTETNEQITIVHKEDLCDSFTSPNIVKLVNSKRQRLAEYSAMMGIKQFCCVKPSTNFRLETRKDVVITLRYILGKLVMKIRVG